MRTLFIKIFLSFWLAMALTSIAYTLLALNTQIGQSGKFQSHFQQDRRQVLEQMLAWYGQIAPALYERGDTSALARFAGKADRPVEARAFLFAADGTTLMSDHDIPKAVQAAANLAARSSAVMSTTNEGFIAIAQPVIGNAGHRYVAAVGMSAVPPWAQLHWQQIFRSFGIRMSVSIIIGSIICYILAWRLTTPIRRLRTAAQQLASGDLSARVGSSLGQRGDEVADLGLDLDRMAEQIEILVETQKTLLRDISHELRSPLARLNVALGLARQHCSTAADGYFDRIERDLERLNQMIGELLTLSLLESGIEQLEHEQLELDALVESVAQDANFEAESRGRKVCVIASEPLTVEGNGEIFRRALENVVRNAARYTGERTVVEIVLQRVEKDNASYAVISVRDHGPGVPEAALTKLFLPFYRVADARDRQSGGTGVGLAITDRAVRLHNGTVKAENAADGGLIIEIRVPIKLFKPNS